MPPTTRSLWEDVPDRVYNVTYGEFGFRCSCGYVSGGVWEESTHSDVPSWVEQVCSGCQRVYRLILQVREPEVAREVERWDRWEELYGRYQSNDDDPGVAV